MQTKRLTLVLKGPEDVRTMLDAMSPETRAEVSPVWLRRAMAATMPDPWIHGFTLVLRETGGAVGQSGFKGPPDDDGVVEIAYGIDAEHQGNGYATEAAGALTDFAFDSGRVSVVRAHTLPVAPASQRVLTKCGFRCVGEVIDPEDGLVWRWEQRRDEAAG